MPSAPPILLLSRRQVANLLNLEACIAAVERAFRLHAGGRSLGPAVLGVAAPGGGFHVKAAGLPLDRLYFAAKVNGNFPGNPAQHGLPAIQGVIVLCDAANGTALAVMDSIEITAQRTAAATAVAARCLARADSSTITICGCGSQGRVQLRALSQVLPLRRAFAYDSDPETAQRFAGEMTQERNYPVEKVANLPAAVLQSDLCVTCTPARQPLLNVSDLHPGLFIAAVGADGHGKQELEPRILARSTVVVDSLAQCAEIGELQHALAAGLMTRDEIHAELGQVLTGERPGRTSQAEVTVFDSTGVALQDVAAAVMVYERAIATGSGTRIGLAN